MSWEVTPGLGLSSLPLGPTPLGADPPLCLAGTEVNLPALSFPCPLSGCQARALLSIGEHGRRGHRQSSPAQSLCSRLCRVQPCSAGPGRGGGRGSANCSQCPQQPWVGDQGLLCSEGGGTETGGAGGRCTHSIFLLLISNVILLWSENVLHVISVLLHLLRHVLWSSVRSVLVNVLYAVEKILFVVFAYSVL